MKRRTESAALVGRVGFYIVIGAARERDGSLL